MQPPADTAYALRARQPKVLRHALIAQIGAVAILWALAQTGHLQSLPGWALALMQGVLAASIAVLFGAARWWLAIHLLFVPCLLGTLSLKLAPGYFLAGFTVLALIYWSSFRSQVPLFLSNLATVHRLAAWLPDQTRLKVLDVGSGTGSFAHRLARLRPGWHISGIETAPLPAWFGRWRSRHQAGVKLLRGDFWQYSLADYDVVYAFLSPVPMPRLGHKAIHEMRAGSWLISNSFPIPGLKPDEILPVTGDGARTLYCYRMRGKTTTG